VGAYFNSSLVKSGVHALGLLAELAKTGTTCVINSTCLRHEPIQFEPIKFGHPRGFCLSLILYSLGADVHRIEMLVFSLAHLRIIAVAMTTKVMNFPDMAP